MRCLEESLLRYVGQTVTIYTTSGGESGSGFTGVLAHVGHGCIRLITSIGAPPTCALGSDCTGWSFGGGRERCRPRKEKEICSCRHKCRCHERERETCREEMGFERGRNWLGSVTEIPIDRIASFTHNAI